VISYYTKWGFQHFLLGKITFSGKFHKMPQSVMFFFLPKLGNHKKGTSLEFMGKFHGDISWDMKLDSPR